MISILDELSIPEDALTFTATRSGGPGGQHVNKASTRVTLLFDVARSPSLSPEQKQLVLERLATRVSREGILRVVSQQHRSREGNRKAAVARFVELLRAALERLPPRTPTKVRRGAKERRLHAKKGRGRLKRDRSKVAVDED